MPFMYEYHSGLISHVDLRAKRMGKMHVSCGLVTGEGRATREGVQALVGCGSKSLQPLPFKRHSQKALFNKYSLCNSDLNALEWHD